MSATRSLRSALRSTASRRRRLRLHSQGTFVATFFLASLTAIECETVMLEDV